MGLPIQLYRIWLLFETSFWVLIYLFGMHLFHMHIILDIRVIEAVNSYVLLLILITVQLIGCDLILMDAHYIYFFDH